jgi:hypothetical protein
MLPARYLAPALALLAFVAVACEAPVHPKDPGIPDALCQPRCKRQHDCDAAFDVASCVVRCERALSPRVVYDREDLIAKQRQCAEQQACVANVDQAITACTSDNFKRLEPTPTAQAFCKARVDMDHHCGDFASDYEHCIYGHKGYSDPILSQMSDCLSAHPCRTYGRCLVAIVGEDVGIEDKDRAAAFRSSEVPKAGPDTVKLHGRIQTEANQGIASANVCLRAKGSSPCVATDDAGAFTLMVPAHEEIAITASATGYGSRVGGLATVGRDIDAWGLILATEPSLRARYAAAGGTYADAATGSIMATAKAPPGSTGGFDGAAMSIAPASGKGPVYFSPDGYPDSKLTATSTWSSGVFAGVAPGEVELHFGPDVVTCVPAWGGWPSKQPNAVRVPIVAGFETRVVMQCHR